MINRNELLRTEEYWFEIMQNQIYRALEEYLAREGISQSQLAERLGVTKGYVSQVLNGNFNYSLKKLIQLSLSLDLIPVFELRPLNEFIENESTYLGSGKQLERRKIDRNKAVTVSRKAEF
jgi:transcriptional regulator with XRE-family HTH domain